MADDTAKQTSSFSRETLGLMLVPILVFGGAWLTLTLLFNWLSPEPEWADAKFWASFATMCFLIQMVSRGGDEMDRKFAAEEPATKQAALMKVRIVAAYSVLAGVLMWLFAPPEESIFTSAWATAAIALLFVAGVLIQCRRYYRAYEERPVQ